MEILTGTTCLPPHTAACVGAFDGMHLGHQALLREGLALAPKVAVVTFDPHPARLLRPDKAPTALQSSQQRAEVCTQLGVDSLRLLSFDRKMAALSASEFAQRYLIEMLRPAAVIVGEDFRFGSDRSGDVDRLRELLAGTGIALRALAPVPDPSDPERKIGSSTIRQAAARGELRRAAQLLGRWYSCAGTVVRGDARGRTLGFPTANLQPETTALVPPGVYAAVLSETDGKGRRWAAVANLGQRPTVDKNPQASRASLEVHAIDQDLGESLYGRRVEVALVEKLRDQERFVGLEQLKTAIAADITRARSLLSEDTLRACAPYPLRMPIPPPPERMANG